MSNGGNVTIASKPVLLYSLHHPNLSLSAPIALTLEYDPDADQVIAHAYDLNVFGYGETELTALSDLRRTVVDLYLELQENRACLTGEALAVWRYLSQVVQSTGNP